MSIILFDMDCTLTPARLPIESKMIQKLTVLLSKTKVGIVTGSGLDYLKQQMSPLWDRINIPNLSNLILYPCNGTQRWTWDNQKKEWQNTFVVDMIDEVGDAAWQNLICSVLGLQNKCVNDASMLKGFSVMGHFTSNRVSLLNWCPIGRDSNQTVRKNFEALDNESDIRVRLKKELDRMIEGNDFSKGKFSTALGGKTSIDIYPVGWDKSFVLQFHDAKDAWFVGDRCFEGGNDYELYLEINENGRGAYQTSGPDNTIKLINENILPNIG
jgi:phosphomannomutase